MLILRAAAILSILFYLSSPLRAGELRKADVLRVIDGDSIRIMLNGKKEHLRLIGVDTAEIRANNKAIGIAAMRHQSLEDFIYEGKVAKSFVKNLVKPGDSVSIELGKQERDIYGRMLGYLFLSNGKMLNEEILKAGLGQIFLISPNLKYAERLIKSYRENRISRGEESPKARVAPSNVGAGSPPFVPRGAY